MGSPGVCNWCKENEIKFFRELDKFEIFQLMPFGAAVLVTALVEKGQALAQSHVFGITRVFHKFSVNYSYDI